MKTPYLLVVFFIFCWSANIASAQVLNGSITLESQADVDAFEYTQVVGGRVQIIDELDGVIDINNLNGLSELEFVDWGIAIINCDALVDLTGLGSLSNAGGVANSGSLLSGLTVANNDLLESFNGLGPLSVTYVQILNNPELTSLANITINTPQTSIRNNPKLSLCNTLTFIGPVSDQNLTGNAYGCNSVNQIVGITPVFNGDLFLNGQNDVDGFSWSEVTGNLIVSNANNMEALFTLTTVGGFLNVEFSPEMLDLEGLNALTSVGEQLALVFNEKLVDLSALDSLDSIGGDLAILSNDSLETITGFSKISTFPGKILIQGNPKLANLDGFSGLTEIGELEIFSNPSLVSLNGLANVSTFNTFINISDNATLPNLDGLENLQSLPQYLSITVHPLLENIDALSNLSHAGELNISNNIILTNINGLTNVTTVDNAVRINNNPNLSICCEIADLITNGGASTFIIENNAPGCNNSLEIVSCGTDCDDGCDLTTDVIIDGICESTAPTCDDGCELTTDSFDATNCACINEEPNLIDGCPQTQVGLDIDGEAAGDRSGESVSLSLDGTRVAIGASFNDGNGNFAGHVRIYEESGGSWTQIGADIDGEVAGDISGRSVSLSADGTRIAIGAPANDGNGNSTGHVRIYEESGGSWTQVGADINGEAANDVSGSSVSLSADGTRIAIGAPSNVGTAGHVRIYEESGDSWTQVGADIDGEAASDLSGFSVSLSADGTRVAIGAPSNDGNGSSAGHVRIYEESGGSWTQVGVDIDGEAGNVTAGFSVSLSANGTRVAIGAPQNVGINTGRVRIYEESGGSWTQVGAEIDGEAVLDRSGESVSLSADGTRVAIGATRNDGNGTDAGHVRIYQESEGLWTQLGVDIDGETAGDRSGSTGAVSLSADGTRVAIGAFLNDGNGTDAGHVRIFNTSNCDDGCPLTTYSFDEATCTIINEQPSCDDNDPNTNDSFDATNCECINEAIVCDDGCPLTTDILVNGICESTAPTCDDGCDLTTDSFDAMDCACINDAPDPEDGCDLTIDSFDDATCTIINEAPTCDDNDDDTTDSFDATNCICVNTPIITCNECPVIFGATRVSKREGDNGNTILNFPIFLSFDPGYEVSFDVVTSDFSQGLINEEEIATAGVDYIPLQETFTFEPSETRMAIEVEVIGDLDVESDELFVFAITNTNVNLSNGLDTLFYFGEILNDDCDDGCDLTLDSFDELNLICINTSPDPDDGCNLTTDSFDEENCLIINDAPDPDDGCDLTIDSFDETTCTIINQTPSCDDNDPNTSDSFDAANCECLNEAIVCDDGCPLTTDVLTNGICESIAPSCDDGCDLTTDSFDAVNCACINDAPDVDDDCDLTIDSFDEVNCIIINESPTCDDNDPNTNDSFDAANCECLNEAIVCDDGCPLTTDVLTNGVCESIAPTCDDACDLTTDSFDAVNCACINDAPDVDDGCDLTIDSFDETTCTIMNEAPTCDDNDPNTNDSFDAANCECVNEAIVCDDGCPLTTDVLTNGVCESIAPSCDDGCDLTTDSFDAANCVCINDAPDVDDGCDLTIDSFDESTCTIINQAPTCDDNDPCTIDDFDVDVDNCACINLAVPGCGTNCPDFEIEVLATDETCIDANDGSIELTAICLTEGPSEMTNLALNKTAVQSSTNGDAVAGRTIDGNTNGNWYDQFSVSSTNWTNQAWWEVDLARVEQIDHIEIWGRTDCCQSFMQNYYVFVSDNPFGSDNLNTILARLDVESYFESDSPTNPTIIPTNLSGRYIRIQLEGIAQLQLAEVKVMGGGNGCNFDYEWDNNIGSIEDPSGLAPGIYNVTVIDQNQCSETTSVVVNSGSENCPDGCTSTENLALDKPSSQSSTAQGGLAERANDGNTNGAFYSEFSVALTNWEANAWWEVDLESISEIETINIWNRTDANSDFLINYYILVSDVPFVSTNLNIALAQTGVSSYFENTVAGTPTTIDIDQSGRYVRIQLLGTSFLGLAEVEVIGCSGSIPNIPTCFDNIQNGDETGIDCGGNSCPPCCLPAGTVCDDSNPDTENDVEDGNCNCMGTPINTGPCTAPTNLALSGTAVQSSTQQGGLAERANDGNTNGSFYADFSVSQTGWEANAWWELDLGINATIESINVRNRTDVNTQFLQNYYVLVSDVPFTSTDLATSLNQPGVSNYLETGIAGTPTTVDIGRSGRYVRIQLNGTAFLSLAEVEVMGCPITQNYIINENELNFFNALKNGNSVNLNWATNTEYKNDYFEVEHSTNRQNFETIIQESSIAQGTLAMAYHGKHLDPQQGTNYYRLKQFYLDGSFIYSPIQEVDFELDLKELLVFPNPAHKELFVALKDFENEKVNIQIFNALGQPMMKKLIDEVSSEPVKFDLNNFSNGVYTLIIQRKNRKLIAKNFVVSKL